MSREWVMYKRYWASTTVSSVVEPVMYLLAFGFGFGALVAEVNGYDYVEFVGTGTVATSVLFGSAFPGMFSTFIKRTYQHTYDAMLAAPVDTSRPGDRRGAVHRAQGRGVRHRAAGGRRSRSGSTRRRAWCSCRSSGC